MRIVAFALLWFVACTGERDEGSTADSSVVIADTLFVPEMLPDAPVQPDTTQLVMPDAPPPPWERGVLSAVAVARDTSYRFHGSWSVRFDRCVDPPLLQVVARGEGFGVIILAAPPEDQREEGEYEVVFGVAGPPDTATARLAIQYFPERSKEFAFRGVGGVLEILRMDSVVEGRLSAALEENTFLDTVLVAAVFEAPLVETADEVCQFLGTSNQISPRRTQRPRSRPVRSTGQR